MHQDSPPARARPVRHDLLTVCARHWPTVAATRGVSPSLSPAQVAAVNEWGALGRPVIARRTAPGDAPADLPVGLPLPPELGKARVALTIPPGVPWRPAAALTLVAAQPSAPGAWTSTVSALLALADSLVLTPRVFGALLWQATTGLAYLHPGSDLDLLWPARGGATTLALLDGLARIATDAPMRIDGEVLTGAGGVNWRELHDARRARGNVVLAKSLDRARFIHAGDVLSADGSP